MQFVVPQFIERESKIFGPINVRQFVILVAAGLLIVIAYKLADFSLFLLEALFIAGIAIPFAFVKINSMPFHYFLLIKIENLKRPGKKAWNKSYGKLELEKTQTLVLSKKSKKEKKQALPKEPVPKSRLSELSLLVDTGGYYHQK